MKRLAAITCGVLLAFGVLGLPSHAQAASITNANQYFIVDSGTATQLKMTNYESAFTGGWTNTPANWTTTSSIAVGDYLRGIFTITSSNIPGGGIATQRTSDGSFELTGVFSTQVSSVTSLGGGTAIFDLVPDAAFETQFGSGAMVAFYNDTSPDFSGTGSLTSSYDSAVNGSLYMVLGAGGSQTWGTDYYWDANGAVTPGVAAFAASLGLLTNNTGIATASFLSTTQVPVSGASAALGTIQNPFALQGNTKVNPVGGSPWQLQSQDPLEAIVVPLPPASWLGATMLLALLGLGIRRSRRRAVC